MRTLIILLVGVALAGACAAAGPGVPTPRPAPGDVVSPAPTVTATTSATPTPSPAPTLTMATTPQPPETPGAIPDIPGTYADSGPWLVFQAGFGIEGGSPAGIDLGLMRADGSDAHRIPGAQYERWHPDWSPDGTMIAYDRWDPTSERAGLATVTFDGSADEWLLECTDPCLGMSYPAWTADGSSVIFEGVQGAGWDDPEKSCHLGLVDTDLGDVTYMLEEVGCSFSYMSPQFSPDDERIVFKRIDESARRSAIFTVAADGSGLRQLTEWGLGARPEWSPDGEWIVFMSEDFEPPFDRPVHLHRVRADGSQMEQLTVERGPRVADVHPHWLPDGSGIIFSHCTGPSICETRIIDPDGSNDRLLVPAFGNQVFHVMWQPPAP